MQIGAETGMQAGQRAEILRRAREIRQQVFIAEQGVSPEEEWDSADHDERTIHLVVTDPIKGHDAGTARVLPPDEFLNRAQLQEYWFGLPGVGKNPASVPIVTAPAANFDATWCPRSSTLPATKADAIPSTRSYPLGSGVQASGAQSYPQASGAQPPTRVLVSESDVQVQLIQAEVATLVPVVHIGRVATCAHARGQGIGRRVMEAAEAAAVATWDLGDGIFIELSAQTRALGFYEKLGYVAVPGQEYLDAGIPHRTARKYLRG